LSEFADKLADILMKGIESRRKGLEREKKGIKPELSEELKKRIGSLNEEEKKCLFAMTMESIRGYWGSPEERLAIIFYLCDSIKTLPKGFLKAVKHNAFMFDGYYIDGRIFRDGDRLFGLSGNLAYYITGDDRIKQGEFYGTYGELWKMIKRNQRIMKKVYNLILKETDDLTWGERLR